jgi:hypothetical protein
MSTNSSAPGHPAILPQTRTHILLLVQDLDIRIINAATGELLRQLTLDPDHNYQPTARPPGPPKGTPADRKTPDPNVGSGSFLCPERSHGVSDGIRTHDIQDHNLAL